MDSNLWAGVGFLFASGWSFYRVLAKKEKHIYGAGVATGVFLILGIIQLLPFSAKIAAKWFFSS